MQPEIPPFILKGSHLLTNFVVSFPSSSGRIHLSPIFVRNLKFNTLTEEEEEKAKELVFTLSLFRSECYELHELASNDVLLVLCSLTVKDGLWHRVRWSETHTKLQQHCPHILYHGIDKDSSRQLSLSSLDKIDVSLSSAQCEALLLRRNKLNNKLKKLKSLRQAKESLQARLQSQLHEFRPSEITVLSPKLMKNVINGMDLNTPAATLSEEMHRFHDILADLEQDYKDEELFWRWIVGSDPQQSFSTSTDSCSLQEATSAINSARAEVEGRILDLLKSKLLSDGSQLQQLYAEAMESVKFAVLPLVEHAAEKDVESSDEIVAPTEREKEIKMTLEAVLQEVMTKTNLVSPIIATVNSSNNKKSSSGGVH